MQTFHQLESAWLPLRFFRRSGGQKEVQLHSWVPALGFYLESRVGGPRIHNAETWYTDWNMAACRHHIHYLYIHIYIYTLTCYVYTFHVSMCVYIHFVDVRSLCIGLAG